ncbi:MAG: hypothetical protein IV090_10150 [Candidatus Sericytochromatia bacterium]|nr:hypothetical protein [Candidatus Sericytochromatia bacterium]
MALYKHQQEILDLKGLWQEENFVFTSPEGEDLLTVQELEPGSFLVRQGAQVSVVQGLQERNQLMLSFQGQSFVLERIKKNAGQIHDLNHSNLIEAPLTGKVLQVNVSVGQVLEVGDPVVILESMKMETALNAPFAAQVQKVHCAAGESVSTGQVLVELEPLKEENL